VLIVLALVAALLWLPSPLGWILFGATIALEVVQTVLSLRWSRRRSVRVGAQTLIGRTAIVVRACRPIGQVKIQGELWQAHCPAGADRGAQVEVTGLEGLTLSVRPHIADLDSVG